MNKKRICEGIILAALASGIIEGGVSTLLVMPQLATHYANLAIGFASGHWVAVISSALIIGASFYFARPKKPPLNVPMRQERHVWREHGHAHGIITMREVHHRRRVES